MSPRILTLALLFTLFGITATVVVVRADHFRKTHYAVGNVPEEIVNQLFPEDVPLTSMRPPAVRLHDPLRFGGATSVISVIEYGDFECEYCRAMHRVIDGLLPTYAGTVRFVFRDFPIESSHKNAMDAAIFSRCAAQQGKYWEAHDKLMTSESLNERAFTRITGEIGIDPNKLTACRKNPEVENAIRRDLQEAQADGIKAVPLIFVGTQAFDHYLTVEELNTALQSAISSL